MTGWNKSNSLILSIFCTRLFLLLLAAAVIFAPQIVVWYFGAESGPVHLPFRITIYLCAVPAALLLFCLDALLRNIRRGKVFEADNIKKLRFISWFCIAIGLITFGAGFYYASFFLVAVAAAFIGLIVRVIKNIFEQAMEIKTENDFTI